MAGCREGRERENLRKLYADDAVSVEAVDFAGMGRERRGLAAIEGKHQWWNDNHDVHKVNVEGPFVHGDDRFGCVLEIDVTLKADGKRQQGRELGIYHVRHGKIVLEEFFYTL